jgi:hypothetical protein
VAAITAAVLWPVLGAGFLDYWDDPDTIARNPDLNPPTFGSVLKYWNPAHPYMDLYVPVTYTVWAAIAALTRRAAPDPAGGGWLSPFPFHAASLVLHMLATVLVFAILSRLLRARGAPGPAAERSAAAGAILFSIHPLQVEAVAWASGLKDVLGGTLALAAIHLYLRSEAPEGKPVARRRAYLAATVRFRSPRSCAGGWEDRTGGGSRGPCSRGP